MNDELMAQFLVEGRELVAAAARDLAVLARAPSDEAALDGCFRAVHTLKGSTGLFDLAPMGLLLHAAEDVLAAIRAGRPAGPADFAALLAAVDEVDRWLDAIEGDGALPAGAAEAARIAVARLGGAEGVPAQAAPEPQAWRAPPEFAGLAGIAIRYVPRADAYFSGDDPVAIIAAVPALTALRILPREGWGPLESYDPFACNLVIEAVSAAGRPAVQAALRLVADQVQLAELLPAGPGAAATGAAATGPAARRTLRVDAARVDRLAGLVDDLVVAKSALAELAAEAERLAGGHGLGQSLRARQAQLDRLVSDLHATVGQVRLVPLAPLFGRFPRLARDIARALGKSVSVETEGGEVEVDKAVVDALFDPLLHVLRNAVDHGVEAPPERRKAGKAETGTIRLAARPDGDRVVIEVTDDGAGIDPARIRDLAVERGLLRRDAADALGDAAAADLVFTPGFSTAAAVSEVSGRGVGMDVVRAAALALGGRVEVAGTSGRGTMVRFVLPVATLLTKVMIVACGPDRYGLALEGVVETARVTPDRIREVRAGRAFLLRDRPVPLVALGALVGAPEPAPGAQRVVVARAGGELVGLAVDAVLDRMDAVVRPMTGLLAGAPGVMGTTLLADGAVLMILDPTELLP
ncbi:chemotaxis protein CheA [Roseococcus sp. SYP-B2431]|uniref:chemotaxis protein CheA n=1 Tax=Roseococcus sp. SYP-B2431 TaxID=2496640 RepID=UPI00103D524A|nr:chemotaxis protein CheA [Roseococcus sp. SYP-B2431]TCH99107.1 chemotaxis protein CheA [Roseococcus sp. SYP-B2431]